MPRSKDSIKFKTHFPYIFVFISGPFILFKISVKSLHVSRVLGLLVSHKPFISWNRRPHTNIFVLTIQLLYLAMEQGMTFCNLLPFKFLIIIFFHCIIFRINIYCVKSMFLNTMLSKSWSSEYLGQFLHFYR